MTAIFALQAAQLAAFLVAIGILLWQSYLDREAGNDFNLYLLGIAYAFAIASIFALFFNHIDTLLMVFGIALVSCSSVYQYLRHRVSFSASILYIFIIISYLYAIASISGVDIAAQSISIGLIAAFIAKRHAPMRVKQSRGNKQTEIRRDIFEIVMGLILVAIILSVKYYSTVYIVVLLSLVGYAVSGLVSKKSRIYSLLGALEREGAFFGEGAVYLAVGTLLIVSFVHPYPLLITGIIALFFSDSVATIFGVLYGRHKLPYNKRKSIEGILMFWASAAIAAFPFVGFYSIAIGAVLALVESASGPQTIDDNISIAIGMIAIYAVALLIV